MGTWEIFWAVVVIFSIISFTYMSAKVIYKGLDELKDMFNSLKD